MKQLILNSILCVSSLWAMNAVAKDWVLALSPNHSDLPAHTRTVLMHLVGQPAGTTITVVDGVRQTTLGRFSVPTDPRYSHPRSILAKNATFAGKLTRWAEEPLLGPVPTNLMTPSLLEFVAGLGSDVVLLGSMRYHDADEPLSSMYDRFPGDGHLVHEPTETPYGTSGIDLGGLRVHWVNLDPQAERMQRHITRFWHLYMDAAGGVLVDVVRALDDVQLERPPRRMRYTRQDSDKLEMIGLPPLEISGVSIFERLITQEPQSLDQTPGRLLIGLSWDAACSGCDLDLYARPYPGAQTLSFSLTQTSEGRYFKDFRKSPEATNGLEAIAFEVPVDLSQLLLGVNLYSGDAPEGVDAEIRLSVGAHTYARTIHVPATEGRGALPMQAEMQAGHSTQAVIIRGVDIIPSEV